MIAFRTMRFVLLVTVAFGVLGGSLSCAPRRTMTDAERRAFAEQRLEEDRRACAAGTYPASMDDIALEEAMADDADSDGRTELSAQLQRSSAQMRGEPVGRPTYGPLTSGGSSESVQRLLLLRQSFDTRCTRWREDRRR
jgi:hypothetical protein